MFYLVEIFQDLSPGGSISSNHDRTAPRRQGENVGNIEVLQQSKGRLNFQILLLIKGHQVSPGIQHFSNYGTDAKEAEIV